MKTNPNKNLKSLDDFITEEYGNKGNSKRDSFEEGFHEFKIGYLLQQDFEEEWINELYENSDGFESFIY